MNKSLKIDYLKKNYLIDNVFNKFLFSNRNKMYDIFKKHIKISKTKKVLDVGTTPSLSDNHNVFLSRYPYKEKITCFSNQDCNILKKKFNGIKIKKGDIKKIKLKKNSFDIVNCSATLEHVGSFQNQIKSFEELKKVSKKYIFLTTPNRNFFLDFHTKLPFLHMLPKKIHRKILRFFGDNFFSKESNLNLLTSKDLKNICKITNTKNYIIVNYKVFFFITNLILIVKNS